MKLQLTLVLFLAVLALALARPTVDILGDDATDNSGVEEGPVESLREVIDEVMDDLTHIVKNKAGVIQFVRRLDFSIIKKSITSLLKVGSTAANAAVEVSNSAVEYMSEVDVEAALNQTEEALKAHKVKPKLKSYTS